MYFYGGDYQSIYDSVNGWYNEISKYDFNNPGFTWETGHFSQVDPAACL